jgi:HEAT repeat protein
MKQQDIENQIIAWFEGSLKDTEKQEVQHLIQQSSEAAELFDLYKRIYGDLDTLSFSHPSQTLHANFYKNLEQLPDETPPSQTQGLIRRLSPLKYAAAIILILLFAGLGNAYLHKSKQLNAINQDMALLKQEIKTLMQHQSTSARIKAVSISQELVQQDEEIRNVLIQLMNEDKSKHVRLAAIDALEKFVTEEAVVFAFLNALKEQEDEFVKIKLINILAEIKEKNALPYLHKIIENEQTSKYLKMEALTGRDRIIKI